jgi:alkylated DNA repair dioxygenase AlkB
MSGAQQPEGLHCISDFLTPGQERELVTRLELLDWDGRGVIKRYGQTVRRRELDFLRDYGRANRQVSPGPPLPEFLEPLRASVAKAAGIASHDIGQVITALYRPGAGIDWHTDSVKAFGDTICSVSLGAACVMHFRKAKSVEVWTIVLEPRSLLIMRGPARWEHQHHIPAVKGLRYSVTLRTLQGL